MANDSLTKKVRETIVELISKGVTDVEAYTRAGVSKSTFYRWLAIGEAVANGESHDEMPKTKVACEARRVFWDEVQRARAIIKERLITESIMVAAFGSPKTEKSVEIFEETRIGKADGKPYTYRREIVRETHSQNIPDWRAAMEYLARRHPDEWGSKAKIDVNIPPDVQRLLPDLLKALERANMNPSEVFNAIFVELANATAGTGT